MTDIRHSVGRSAKNVHADVLVIQDLLNDHNRSLSTFLAEDGIVGSKTIAAIERFQLNVVKIRPDGRVDPAHRTILTLNGEPLSVGQSPLVAAPVMPAKGLPPTHISSYKREMRQVFKEKRKENLWDEYWKFAANDITPEVKRFFSMIGRAEEARQVARFYIVVRDLNVEPGEMKHIFQAIMKIGKPKWTEDFVVNVYAAPATKAGAALKKISDAGKVVGFFVFVIEYIDHWKKGDYHMAFVAIYKEWMGKAVGWGGYIDTIQSFVAACLPKSTKTDTAYKMLKAVNPVDLGAQAVDTALTACSALVEMAVSDKIDERRVYRLADRIKKSSAGIFYELGDDMAKSLCAMADMPDNEFDEMMSAGNIFNWLNDFWLTKYAPPLMLYRWVKSALD